MSGLAIETSDRARRPPRPAVTPDTTPVSPPAPVSRQRNFVLSGGGLTVGQAETQDSDSGLGVGTRSLGLEASTRRRLVVRDLRLKT